MPGYLNSRECELADNLTMAYSANDIEKLDKAKKSPEMHYLDFEVQKLGKTLSLFDECFTDDTPIHLSNSNKGLPPAKPVVKPPAASTVATSGTSGGKSDLFAKPAPKTSASTSAASNSNKPPPPPPPPAPAPEADSDNEEEAEGGAPADLGDVEIPEDGDDEGDSDAGVDVDHLHVSTPAIPAPEEEEEDEDEIDLS